ncbi:MAG TPA: tetratricopeptide repeat protein [Verrucomicrobiota bacterium]|nr:tetratricopeptide repeat protein [Verrucomicrobiota bacterium]HNU52818.1 tetratricopeptide repeat protein [Verrucomicrobiota bacterium]
MVTTKKWGGARAGGIRSPAWRPQRSTEARGGTPTRLLVCGLALVSLMTACDPPGRQSLLRGERCLERGEPDKAIESLKEAITLFTTNTTAVARAWNNLGLAYHYTGRPAEAAQAYQNALAKDFNLVAARYNRGCLLLEQNNLTGAISELTTYVTHRPNDVQGWLKLGTAQLRARLLDAADRGFQRVLEFSPSPPIAAEALNNLGVSQAVRRKPADAFRFFHAALRCVTNHPPALLNQAVVAQTLLRDRPLALQRYRAYVMALGTNPPPTAVLSIIAQLEVETQARAATTNLTSPAATNGAVRLTQAPSATNHTTAAQPKPGPAPDATARTPTPDKPAATFPPTADLAAAPPGVRVTRPSPPPPNVVTAKVTEVVASTPAPATNPPAVIEPPPAAMAPPPALEVVTIPPEPEIKPAQDLAPPLTRPEPAANAARASPPAVADAGVAAPAPAASPSTTVPAVATAPSVPSSAPHLQAQSDAESAPRKSFLQRINPLRLFGGRDKKAAEAATTPAVTPLPPPRPATAETAAAASPAPAALKPANRTPAPPTPPVFPRYAYQRPSAPSPGDTAHAAPLFQEGLEAQKTGKPSQAIAAYRQAVQADPAFHDAWFNLGVAAHDAGQWPEALAAYEHALALKPGEPGTRLNFALALDRANHPVDAAQELETLLATQPGNVDAHLTLANLCSQKLDDRSRARQHYTKVLELAPGHPQAAAIRRWLAANR